MVFPRVFRVNWNISIHCNSTCYLQKMIIYLILVPTFLSFNIFAKIFAVLDLTRMYCSYNTFYCTPIKISMD